MTENYNSTLHGVIKLEMRLRNWMVLWNNESKRGTNSVFFGLTIMNNVSFFKSIFIRLVHMTWIKTLVRNNFPIALYFHAQAI